MEIITTKSIQRKETPCAVIAVCFIIYAKRIQDLLINDLEKKNIPIDQYSLRFKFSL